MKKLFLILSLSVLFFAGCSDLGTNDPIDNSQVISGEKVSKWQFMDLPEIKNDASNEIEATFYTGKIVIGQWGASLPMTRVYWSNRGIVKVKSKLDVPAGAFSGLKLIWYSVNDESALTDFHPGMEFDKDLTFDLKIENIDLSDIEDPSQIEFAYVDDSQSIEIAPYEDLVVDIQNNTLEVKNAKIGHFSRYGFVRGTEYTNPDGQGDE